jgi:hypothetical protein
MYTFLDTNILIMLTKGRYDMTSTSQHDQGNLAELAEAIKKGAAQIERQQLSKRIKYGKAAKKVQREQQQ